MMADFHFLRPAWFLLLPLLFALVWWAMRARGRGGVWSRVCDAALLPFVVQGGATNLKTRAGWLLAGAGALAVVALAGPVWDRQPVPVFRSEGALVIALDLSASMNSADIKPTRLERARFKIADILHARKTGQTALLVFAAQAFVVTPLTNDVQTLLAHLSVLEPSIMPSQGSEPAAALEMAAKLLTQGGMPNGHVLLITDGADEAGMARAREVASAGSFNLSVLGMGTADGAPIPDASGDFIKGTNGALVMSHLDSAALQSLARDGRGIYLESRADDGDVSALSRYLDDDHAAHAEQLEKLATNQWNEVGPWLLLPLLPLAALAFRRGVLVLLAAIMLGGVARPVAADWWRTPDQAGAAAFEHKDYAGAAQSFQDPAWRAAARYRAGDFAGASEDLKNSDSALALYNRGNALARQGQLPEALAAYDAALTKAPQDADAKFNRELVAKALEKQQKQQQKDQQAGEDKKQDKQSQGDQSKQQSGGEKDGQSDQDNSGSTNAGGGERSKEKQHNDQASQDSSADGTARKQAEQARNRQDDGKKDGEPQAAQAKSDDKPAGEDAERKQATEQWLGQIRDEPAMLLKRKFKYQYDQIYGGKGSETNPW